MVAILSVAVALVLLSTAVLPALTGSSYRQVDRREITDQVLRGTYLKANVTVLGGTDFLDLAEDALGSKAATVIAVSDSASLAYAVDREGMIVVDCAGASESFWDDYGGILGAMLLKGTPIMLVNDAGGMAKRLAEENSVSYVGGTGDDEHPITVKALKHDPLGGYSGSLDLGGKSGNNDSLSDNLRTAYGWAVERLGNASPTGIVFGNRLTEGVYSYSYCSGDAYEPYGRFTVIDRFLMMSYQGAGEWQEYYATHHYFESDPGHGAYGSKYRTASMVNEAIYSQGSIVRYYPSTVYGADSVGIYLEAVTYNHLLRWEYDIRDVTVLDNSDFGMEKARWIHQPGEDSQASWMPYVAEPGNMVMIDPGTSVEFTELYSITWERPLLFGGGSYAGTLAVEGRIVPSS